MVEGEAGGCRPPKVYEVKCDPPPLTPPCELPLSDIDSDMPSLEALSDLDDDTAQAACMDDVSSTDSDDSMPALEAPHRFKLLEVTGILRI